MRAVLVLLSGILFGMGVTLSGMVNPMRVLNFLDIFGAFDPTLVFVMASALVVTFVLYRWILRRPKPILAETFFLPQANRIDASLLSGAVVFGLGWGLTGLCPGPAIAGLAFGYSESFIFVIAMVVGAALARISTGALGLKAAQEVRAEEG